MSPLIALLLSTLASPALADADDEDGFEFVTSLPTEEDRVAWSSPGFRMELGYGHGGLWGAQAAPDATLQGALIRPGVRLDGPWSLYTTLAYSAMTEGLAGAQYAMTLEPVYHLSDAVRLGVGLGYGGIIEASSRPSPDPAAREALAANRTLDSDGPPIGSCTGVGPVAAARLEWWIVLGPLSSMGLSFETGWQRTDCEHDTGRREPDTGKAIVERQGWAHQSWRSGLLFGWR